MPSNTLVLMPRISNITRKNHGKQMDLSESTAFYLGIKNKHNFGETMLNIFRRTSKVSDKH